MYLMGDLQTPPVLFTVERSGFRPVRTEFPTNPLIPEGASTDFGVVRMEPDAR